MSDLVWVAIIAAVPPILTVLLATWLQSRSLGRKVDAVHALANDRLTKALEKIQELQRILDRGP